MGLATKLKRIFESYSPEQSKKLIKMAWEDKVSFKEINKAFDLSPNDVEKFMRFALPEKDFKRWKIRQEKRSHKKGRPHHRLYDLHHKDESQLS